MVEPGTVAAITSAPLVLKVLGPTADYLGESTRDWTERRAHNVRSVFERAGRKLGDALHESGTVPPRVLKGVLQEGQFAEDALMAEYLGGVLAASRTPSGGDDRPAAMSALIGRLSTAQLRFHYLVYAGARASLQRRVAEDSLVNLYQADERRGQRVYVPMEAIDSALRLDESADASVIPHCVYGLIRENLLDDVFDGGGGDHLRSKFGRVLDAGYVLTLSIVGIELFMTAHGIRGVDPVGGYLDQACATPALEGVEMGLKQLVLVQYLPSPTSPELAAE